MRIVITGCNGSVGKRVVMAALKAGHTVAGVDNREAADLDYAENPKFSFNKVDLHDYDASLAALHGADAVIHLAAVPHPADFAAITHNTNVILSWNVLRAAAELGVKYVAQASSVNVIALKWAKEHKFDYLPLDEEHPCNPDEPYGLAKVVAELQAGTILRRYPSMRIASLRMSWAVPNKEYANQGNNDPGSRMPDLWGYTQEDAGADAFILAISPDNTRWSGHEAFFITAPDTSLDVNSMVLKEKYWPRVPMKGERKLEGREGFFDCTKAERLLGWVHNEAEQGVV